MPKKQAVEFVLDRETPGTYLYREVDAGTTNPTSAQYQNFPTVYIKKRVFNGDRPPRKITLTIDW